MATIAPGRLHDVSNAADFVALTETNFEILTVEVFKQEATYVSEVPTTTIGPPTTGSQVLNEIWKDALGGMFKCTVAGTPGTGKQMLPAAVTADPESGTIPDGYPHPERRAGNAEALRRGLFVGDRHRHHRREDWILGRGARNSAGWGRTGPSDAGQR